MHLLRFIQLRFKGGKAGRGGRERNMGRGMEEREGRSRGRDYVGGACDYVTDSTTSPFLTTCPFLREG